MEPLKFVPEEWTNDFVEAGPVMRQQLLVGSFVLVLRAPNACNSGPTTLLRLVRSGCYGS